MSHSALYATNALWGDVDGPQPMSRFLNERLALAKVVKLVLDEMPSRPRFFLDNGTLLGLWRDGELIDKDDDFDFGLLVDAAEFSPKYVLEFQKDLQRRLDHHSQCLFDGGGGGQGATDDDGGSRSLYQSRVIDSYAHKIEIYDASHGSFPLNGSKYEGARYHHVSCDLQFHVQEAEENPEQQAVALEAGKVVLISGSIMKGGVKIQHSDFTTRGHAPGDAYEPFGSIRYADTDWPVPAQQNILLSYLYGYVGTGAEFDSHSMLYRKKLLPADDSSDTAADDDDDDDMTKQTLMPELRLYTDMCADLFHAGHVNYLRQCQAVADNVFLIVGIHSDATIQSYKRASVCTMEERVGVVEACRFVDQVVRDAPLRVTEAFMEEHNIDFVIHGTETPEAERQAMYDVPIGRGMYTEVPRTGGISTTELIDRIASRLAVDYEDHALPSERQPVRAVVREMTGIDIS